MQRSSRKMNTTKNILILMTVACLSLALSGCGTLYACVDSRSAGSSQNHHFEVYPATKIDIGAIKYWSHDDGVFAKKASIVTLLIIDLPISVITDTCLLPVDWYLISHKKEKTDSKHRMDPAATNAPCEPLP